MTGQQGMFQAEPRLPLGGRRLRPINPARDILTRCRVCGVGREPESMLSVADLGLCTACARAAAAYAASFGDEPPHARRARCHRWIRMMRGD